MSTVGIVAERPGEARVSSSPSSVKKLVSLGYDVVVEAGAGVRAAFTDEAFAAAGARIVVARTAAREQRKAKQNQRRAHQSSISLPASFSA